MADPARLDDLLEALRLGRLWLPLPDDGGPMTDGSAVYLPTVRYLGEVFVPAYTSAARLLRAAADRPALGRPPGPGRTPAGIPMVPHAVVRAADLARRLPAGIGIALNPAAAASVPVSPAGVAALAAEHGEVGGCQVSVGPPPATPQGLLAAVRAGLRLVPAAREAATAWLTVRPGSTGAEHPGAEHLGAGLVLSVGLDDPADGAARDAVVGAVQRAVSAAPGEAAWPVDVTFPGEGEPDIIDRWVATAATTFYTRAVVPVGLPAPRPPSM